MGITTCCTFFPFDVKSLKSRKSLTAHASVTTCLGKGKSFIKKKKYIRAASLQSVWKWIFLLIILIGPTLWHYLQLKKKKKQQQKNCSGWNLCLTLYFFYTCPVCAENSVMKLYAIMFL